MNPAIGWTLLSRDALQKAESRLFADAQGVRDEIGFLTLHQVYADRFFPGTSVLHTRLRYALFVPWIYERIIAERSGGNVAARIQRDEIRLTGRLKAAGEHGVIGIRWWPKPPAQPASVAYWSALGQWGILRANADGSLPSRSAVHRQLNSGRSTIQALDDDKESLEEERALFVTLPPRPKAWSHEKERFDFVLTTEEAEFVRGQWIGLRRPDGAQALLARLAEQRVDVTRSAAAWSRALWLAADGEDRTALQRAKQVAALAAIGRAIYATQVETLRAEDDRIATEKYWRTEIRTTIEEHRDDALDLKLEAVASDFPPGVSRAVLPLLEATLAWLRDSRPDVRDLLPFYAPAESGRKGIRARLPLTADARSRRAQWKWSDTPADPLHYRWGNVRQLLTDMQEAQG